jgi:ribonuclease HI
MNYDVHIYTDGAAKGNLEKEVHGKVMESMKEGKTYRKEFFAATKMDD